MYLALTYDHRLLDGREAVTFLVKVCRNGLDCIFWLHDADCFPRSRNTLKTLGGCCWARWINIYAAFP